jgi:hypothetical protein
MLRLGPQLSPTVARRRAWWVLAVLVLALLAPGISAALAKARGELRSWEDICRSPASVQLASGGEQPASKVTTALDQLTHGHCPACHLQAQGVAAAPPVAGTPLPIDLGFEAPERFWSAPQTAHAWRAAPARAPPLLA